MTPDAARDFLRHHHHAIITTHRRDGSLQQSPVVAGCDDAGRAVVSVTEDRAKTKNVRHDPRVTLCVFTDGFFGPWVQIDGTAELMAATTGEGMDALVELYRQASGEHPDWDDYRRAMVEDRRLALRITIERVSPA